MKQTLTVITFFSIFLCVSFYAVSEENIPQVTTERGDTFTELKKQFGNYDRAQVFESDEDDDLKIIFDLEDIYPLVDYDTMCAPCEIEDFIEHADLVIDPIIADVPQAPQLVDVVMQDIQKPVTDIVVIEETSESLPAPKKRNWFGKKSKKNKNVKK